ncbi:MAG: helix-turn-helix domain-containing protein [Planctomycetes bacterium]|nr:helix-turn-helix domain-containing protein [Planctomycetota bacterium]
MITNERQYKITNTQLKKLDETIKAFDIKAAAKQTKSKILAKAELDALQSEYENLSLQLKEYETLKSGTVEIFEASNLEELPSILIRARIAKGFSQRQLANALSLKEQQIQRYEAEEYASANLRRLAEVAKALSLNISEVAEFQTISQGYLEQDSNDFAWNEFPIKEMYFRGWFEDFSGSLPEAMANAEELVGNFVKNSLGTPIQAAAARQRIRLGGVINLYALIAWQCYVITIAKNKESIKKYKKEIITNRWFTELAHLSAETDSPLKAVEYLKDFGIHLIVVPHLSHTHLDGAAFLLSGSPVIGMTLRHDRLDNFWFVLFHELIHIQKHLHKGKIESIFDDLDAKANDIEQEADELAGEILIPESKWETALARYLRNENSIKDFANELDINPAIVAGKIRREADNYIILKDMVGQGEVRKCFSEVEFP